MDHECNKEPEIKRIEAKTDQMLEHFVNLKVDIAKIVTVQEGQAKVLDTHMKRTEAAEGRLDKLEIPYRIIAFIGIPLGIIASVLTILAKFGII